MFSFKNFVPVTVKNRVRQVRVRVKGLELGFRDRVRIRNIIGWRCWSTHFDDVIHIYTRLVRLPQDACVRSLLLVLTLISYELRFVASYIKLGA